VTRDLTGNSRLRTTVSMSSLSSDTFLTSSSSGSPSSSVENISGTVEKLVLSVFTFISPTHQSVTTSPAPPLHSPNLGSGSSQFSLDANHSPSPPPAYCSCINNDIGAYLRANGMSATPAGYMDPYSLDDPETLHWKYHHQYGRKLIMQHQPTKCNCHVQHSTYHHPQMNHVLSDNNYIRLLPRTGDGLLLRSLEKGGKLYVNTERESLTLLICLVSPAFYFTRATNR